MIIRIFSEGQYRVPDELHDRLNKFDTEACDAVDADDQARFRESYGQLLDLVRSEGTPLADDDLVGSDLMLPPADITLEEARTQFKDEGLIPD